MINFTAINLIDGISIVKFKTNSTLYETIEGDDRLSFVFKSEEPIDSYSYHTICRAMLGRFDMTETRLDEYSFAVTIGSLTYELKQAIKHYGEILGLI